MLFDSPKWLNLFLSLQSWLISLFMDCPPNMGFICPSDTAKKVNLPALGHPGSSVTYTCPLPLCQCTYAQACRHRERRTTEASCQSPPTSKTVVRLRREELAQHLGASQAVENAIREGIIYWHAFPYNGQLELMDERHVRESVQLTQELDAKYGYKPKITLSQVRAPHSFITPTCVFMPCLLQAYK